MTFKPTATGEWTPRTLTKVDAAKHNRYSPNQKMPAVRPAVFKSNLAHLVAARGIAIGVASAWQRQVSQRRICGVQLSGGNWGLGAACARLALP